MKKADAYRLYREVSAVSNAKIAELMVDIPPSKGKWTFTATFTVRPNKEES